MSTQRPDVTDEEIGLRSFRIRREKAVERAMERIRQGLGPQWSQLSIKEIDSLHWMLGELWSHIERGEWEAIAFSALRFSQVVKILDIATAVHAHERKTGEATDEVFEIVKQG